MDLTYVMKMMGDVSGWEPTPGNCVVDASITDELAPPVRRLDACAAGPGKARPDGRLNMFRWAIIFAVVALVAALLGFGGIAGLSADFAKILLVIGVVLFIVAFVFGRGRRTLP